MKKNSKYFKQGKPKKEATDTVAVSVALTNLSKSIVLVYNNYFLRNKISF